MIGRTNKTLKMRVLLVDDDLGNPGSMRGRVLTELVDEFAERNAELIKAISFDDALAAVVSDAALHCVCVDWTLGKNDRPGAGIAAHHPPAQREPARIFAGRSQREKEHHRRGHGTG